MATFLLFSLIPFAQALPIEIQLQNALRNGTLLQDTTFTGWSDDPSFRGTSDILWSCLVTIFASIYTSVHLDVPLMHISKSEHFRARVKWVFIAIVAPELVLHAAFNQYYKARRLISILQVMETQKLDDQNKHPHCFEKLAKFWSTHVLGHWLSSDHKQPVHRSNKYCLQYGFWAVMGGFVIDTTEIYNTRKRVALTPYGVIFLAKHGYFLEMPKDQIADRSKASAVAKALVCIQILWMLWQTLIRVAVNYPLTLLEVHTTVHVICALCIYALWWHKPLDVEEPVVIDSSNYKDIIACITMASLPMEKPLWSQLEPNGLEADGSYPGSENNLLYNPEAHLLNLDSSKLPLQINKTSRIVINEFSEEFEFDAWNPDNLRISMHAVEHGLTNNSHVFSPTEESQSTENLAIKLEQSDPYGLRICVPGFRVHLGERDLHRWYLYTQGLIKIGTIASTTGRTSLYEFKGPEYCLVTEEVTTGSIHGHSPKPAATRLFHHIVLDFTSFTAFWLPILHGGIHLAARNQKFPSYYEALIWKISAASTMAICPASFLCFSVLYWCKKRGYTLESHKKHPAHFRNSPLLDHSEPVPFSIWLSFCLGRFAFGMILILGTIFYLSRIYLVVESFISLRDVPIGVFAATPWVQAFPHI